MVNEVNDLLGSIHPHKERTPEEVAEHKRDIERRANTLFNVIMDEMANIRKKRKGLKPARIYLGMYEWSTLGQWSLAQEHMVLTNKNETLAGLPFYRVSEAEHLYIAWE